MSKVKIQGNASGTGVLTLTSPNTDTDRTITLPDSTGTVLDSTSSLDASKLTGALPAISGASLTGVGGDLSFGGDTFGANKTIGSNDNYALSFETNATERLQLTNDGRGLSQFTAKAWVNFNGTGTVAIRDSHNVSSISDGGTGYYTVNWTNNLANANYSVSITNRERLCKPESIDLLTSSMFFNLRQDGGSYMDSDKVFTQVFGD